MSAALRIGVTGLGTVGGGVVKLLGQQADILEQRCGCRLELVAVSALEHDPDLDLSAPRWFDDALALTADPEIDVVVELIGGAEGIAKAVAESAIANGKSLVTANKALIARHGLALAQAAETAGVQLCFEAAVAGGIPILKALKEGLAGNRLSRVYGILNGTCNYILTEMQESGRSFAGVLQEAQALGYAEADPSFDIDGVDAAHKLAILTSVAFGCPVDLDALHVEGIREITAIDIAYAAEFGYAIKLLAIAELTERGIEQRVHPCLVARNAPIAHVDGVFNAVVAEGDFIDQAIFEGHGAGRGPTASAVVSDLVDIARGIRVPSFGLPVAALQEQPLAAMLDHVCEYYVRLMVLDQPGVMAEIAAILRDESVSIESVVQRGRAPDEVVPVIIITHDAGEAAIRRVLDQFSQLEVVVEPPCLIRIETL
ncbi:MAG: homoserine dehydrogenase [Alphaproteobacteria bacterium]|jgi:homoserine dehydrogenase|nr:homoserine dehydrogenase [Rhodospirillaceae bacterium]MDP6406126.1 homoserine dehydrogenase [Alphaproteobacteria bacterium]MDP6623014.1 homoserine dehydrogenase [Alphaproteobacteria bacterium]|tara:strand:- start:265 stop:1551 length:1287 start_codon:yes stop_codon:yes gene_type:complete